MSGPLEDPIDGRELKAEERLFGARKAGERADLREVLNSEAGERVLWRVLALAGVLENAHHAGASRDYMLGRQSVGQDIAIMLEDLAPGAFWELGARSARNAAAAVKERESVKREAKRG